MKAQEEILTEEAKFNVLTEVCSFINSAMPYDQQLQAIVEAANKLMGVNDSSLLLRDEEAGLLYFHLVTGEKSHDLRRMTLQPGEGIAGWVIEHGIPVAVSDVNNDPRFSPRIGQTLNFTTRSIVCVPIRSGAKVIGAFEAINRLDGQPFENKDIPLLTAFVALITVVLENSHHHRDIARTNLELEQLVASKAAEIDAANRNLTVKAQRLALTTKIISHINSTQSMPEMLHGVIDQFRRLLGFDYATVSLLESSKDTILLLELAPVPVHSFTEGILTAFDDPVINYVVYYKRALYHNRSLWYRCFLEEGRFIEKQLGAMFSTPILSSDTVWGTLNLGSVDTREYHKEVQDIVAFVATQIGVAFERDKMRKTLEEMNQELNNKTFELRKSIIKMGDANLRLFDMQQQLREKDKKMKKLLDEVQETNEELNATLAELKQAQSQLVQTEKMASLGQLVGGIAHELNTPAGAIKAASEIIPDYLHKIFDGYDTLTEVNIEPRHRKMLQHLVTSMVASAKDQTRKTTSAIREQSKLLIQTLQEHGVRNSRTIAKDIARSYLEEHLDALLELFAAHGAEVIMEFLNNCNRVIVSARDNLLSIEAISKIVRALRAYSDPDQAQERNVDVNDDLENTLTILHSQIAEEIKIVRKFAQLPPVPCLGSELNQVWTHILQNALQALDGKPGTITIETAIEHQTVIVRISDTGAGISEEIIGRIFDPFFTTHRGKKTGLGLSIAQKIVAKHNGRITGRSVPGNTCFEVSLPTARVRASS